MMGKQTIADVRQEITAHADRLSADLNNAADTVALAVLAIGVIATVALLVAIAAHD